MSTLAVPRNISPFVRACRWGLFLTGIAYGHFHYNHLVKKEKKIQAHEQPIRERRDARIAKERETVVKKEMNTLAKEVGVPTRD